MTLQLPFNQEFGPPQKNLPNHCFNEIGLKIDIIMRIVKFDRIFKVYGATNMLKSKLKVTFKKKYCK